MDLMVDELSYEFLGLDATELEGYVQENGVSGIETFFKKKLSRWREIEINMAITGDAGSGKSSFINAIRGLDDDDTNAATVGVTECTTEPKCFSHPYNEMIKFWDLPGIGTPKFPDLKTYCSKVQLEKYDTFLIFTDDRFTEYDLQLAKKIKSLQKNFFLIRTKIDNSVRQEKRKKSFNEEVMLTKIRNYCYKNVEDLVDGGKDIFLISNHHPSKWEFARLTEAILDVLPARQRESLTLSLGILTSFSTDVLKRKVQVLQGRVWKVAAASAAAALVPLPGLSLMVDIGLITAEIRFYRSQLGLPEEGSTEFLHLTGNSQERVRKFCVTTAAQVSTLIAAFTAESAVEDLARFIPFIGLGIASGMSFMTIYHFLHSCLTSLEKTALSLLDEISILSIGDLDID